MISVILQAVGILDRINMQNGDIWKGDTAEYPRLMDFSTGLVHPPALVRSIQ
jgi:hypothetical protein